MKILVYETILRIFRGGTHWKSSIIRSPKLRVAEIADGFPDTYQKLVPSIVDIMTEDHHTLIKLYGSDGIRYALNPNKQEFFKEMVSDW